MPPWSEIPIQLYTLVTCRDSLGAGAHSQGKTLDELRANLHQVIELLLQDGAPLLESEFVGIQTVVID